MSRAKTVCLTFRDFLNGPLNFQVPEGYRRLQLNHFSVVWDYKFYQQEFNQLTTVALLGLLSPEDAPIRTAEEGHETEGFRGVVVGADGNWLVNPNDFTFQAKSTTINQPGQGLNFPWIGAGSFSYPVDLFEENRLASVLYQKTILQLPYATVVPSFVQLSCTGLGAWNDIISVCTYPGNAPALGMQGNTYEIINPSISFTVLDDCLKAINNVTLVVQFTLL